MLDPRMNILVIPMHCAVKEDWGNVWKSISNLKFLLFNFFLLFKFLTWFLIVRGSPQEPHSKKKNTIKQPTDVEPLPPCDVTKGIYSTQISDTSWLVVVSLFRDKLFFFLPPSKRVKRCDVTPAKHSRELETTEAGLKISGNG